MRKLIRALLVASGATIAACVVLASRKRASRVPGDGRKIVDSPASPEVNAGELEDSLREDLVTELASQV
ncbi:MAG: hypothetical protein HKN13_00775 [Rhodothermales bacterium]|nr:hypothetical protein [Rhodothermales bacterium]